MNDVVSLVRSTCLCLGRFGSHGCLTELLTKYKTAEAR